ncbi:MAG: hypothetical protein K8F91_26885 [Candidatus Obscuribacterales bacterium]|nr:hypothetical protein [Candidatus Obscuribacterales bacterium]
MENCLIDADYRLGQLLVNFGVITSQSVERACRLSAFTTLPLGRTLVMLEYVPEIIVRSVVEAQSMLRDRLIELCQAREAIGLVKTNNWTFSDALISLGVDATATRGSRLGELLTEARRIDDKQLALGLMISDNCGLPLGQVFILMNRISEDYLRITLALQRELRAGFVERTKVITRLMRASSADETATNMQPATSVRIKLGELLVVAGVTDEAQMSTAATEAQRDGKLLGEHLLDRGILSSDVLSLSLRLQSMLWNNRINLPRASDILKEAFKQENTRSDGEIGPTPPGSLDESKLEFYDFLRLSGYLNRNRVAMILEKIIEQPRLASAVLKHATTSSGDEHDILKDATKIALRDSSTLRFILKETLPDESSNIDSALVLHQLLQAGKLSLCQALFNFSVKRSGIENLTIESN